MSSPPPEIIGTYLPPRPIVSYQYSAQNSEQLRPEDNLALFCGVHKAYNALFARQFPTKESLDALQARRPELFDWNAEPPEEWIELVKEEEESKETEVKAGDVEAGVTTLPDAPIPSAGPLPEEKQEDRDVVMGDPVAEDDPVAEQLRVEAESAQSGTDAEPNPSLHTSIGEAKAEEPPPKRPKRQTRTKRASTGTALADTEPPPTKKPKSEAAIRRASGRVKLRSETEIPPKPRLRGRSKGKVRGKGNMVDDSYEVLALQPWKPVIRFCVYDQIRRRLANVWGPARLKYYPKTELDELDYDRLIMDCMKVKSSGNVWFINREVGRRGYLERNLKRGRKEKWRAEMKL